MGSGRLRDDGAGVTRRNFLKLGAAMGGIAALQGLRHFLPIRKKDIDSDGAHGRRLFVIEKGIAGLLTKYAGVKRRPK